MTTSIGSGRPRWGARAIADDIRAQIRAGDLKPGDALPTWRELAERYDVSLSTITHAMAKLVDSGDAIGHQGKGTYVTER